VPFHPDTRDQENIHPYVFFSSSAHVMLIAVRGFLLYDNHDKRSNLGPHSISRVGQENERALVQVETVCVIDVRENEKRGRRSDQSSNRDDDIDSMMGAEVAPLPQDHYPQSHQPSSLSSLSTSSNHQVLFRKSKLPLALANDAVLEKKKEWQRIQKQKQRQALEQEKLKWKEQMWSGRAGGMDLKAATVPAAVTSGGPPAVTSGANNSAPATLVNSLVVAPKHKQLPPLQNENPLSTPDVRFMHLRFI
jgi:hypothetical protein